MKQPRYAVKVEGRTFQPPRIRLRPIPIILPLALAADRAISLADGRVPDALQAQGHPGNQRARE